jgi:hypothetical protein
VAKCPRKPSGRGESRSPQRQVRQDKWASSIAVGSNDYVEIVLSQLGVSRKSRRISVTDDQFILKESEVEYRPILEG